MREKKIIYQAYNRLQKVKSYFFQIVLLGAFIYSSFHFTENPIVISVILAFLVFCYVIAAGYQKIVLYEECISVEFIHPISKFSRSRLFKFDDIRSIDVNLQLSRKNYWISEILSSYMPGNSFWNILIFQMKNGKEIEVATKIYKNEVLTILNKLKDLSGNKIVFS